MTKQSPSNEFAGNGSDGKVLVYAIQAGDEATAMSALADQRNAIERALIGRATRELGADASEDAVRAARERGTASADHWMALETERMKERIARRKARDALRQQAKAEKDRRSPAPRAARPAKVRKLPDPPSDEEASILIVQVRDRLHGALERAAEALSEKPEDLLREDPRAQPPSADLRETIALTDTGITPDTQGSGPIRVTRANWGSIRKLWALRPALVRIDVQLSPLPSSRKMRDEFLRRVEGVVAAVVKYPDASAELGAQVKEWLRARDVLVLSPEQLAELLRQTAGSDAIAYVRGGVLYLRALMERIERVRYALERVSKSHDYANADIDANKPLNHEKIFSAIEKHCDEELRAAVADAQQALAKAADVVHARIEPWISSHPKLLKEVSGKLRRNGGNLPDGLELHEVAC